MSRDEFAKCPRLTAIGIAAIVKPVVKENQCAVLQRRRDTGEDVPGGFVQIAVDVKKRDRGMHSRDDTREHLGESALVQKWRIERARGEERPHTVRGHRLTDLHQRVPAVHD